ncbi:TadE family protein [Aporhodopirellula aestuarii]|uniref:Pilus assembly protein n=1 Tax=Aporhodopirellula aestuarii TaxID=2950107 RepID=A0ABT0U9B3_9BACT|nr:TadE family protein [Aporhodopirellula aestuarii]MCM2373499.1 pilus assembly protein [Aporhodopirellula aestuarii]
MLSLPRFDCPSISETTMTELYRRQQPLTQRCQRIAGRRRSRRGAAAVEFAVCLPILVLLVFGSIEASCMIFLKQTLHVAAYEATRVAIRDGRSNADGEQSARQILEARSVNGFDIRFPNGEAFDADRGAEIVAEISAPSAPNSPLIGQFISDRVLTARVVMIKQ